MHFQILFSLGQQKLPEINPLFAVLSPKCPEIEAFRPNFPFFEAFLSQNIYFLWKDKEPALSHLTGFVKDFTVFQGISVGFGCFKKYIDKNISISRD